ncbi:divalent-cation tolerance protein CutA [Aliarcobacter butzleri]|jgi:periplasmic divalent cation tolerance protein|uniref:Divalent-cation tolerance protein CutA n=1 Tax=Aliarcobacter butzleri TaxID=28197 RepID=A0AAP4UY21_9BACT|nr:divalent-cation tolerance protein CutA [Aliarcobacter butzleri]MCT7557014.1 divalent-cation tolerance protein CutA [Aliarcobacter butzleri]MCT7613274.1 divalent-cation tolerance protein CutA [Aliarcobacter butzleri]MCT7641839.1 divalent-cation tolerance protein CutA [Aliarcobacter butzleri]MDN5053031.1 divalent-cation tolerance protein CutA [Aliarcobacter butzleri]MDN5075281.1 divalent-cation tolerance protein CutA [Aliarcobacter butzleri]
MKTIIIQTTCSSEEEAQNIAKILIEEKFAACIQLSQIKSFYNWDNQFCSDKETLLNIKTRKKHFKKIKSKIKELHSYDVPEIIQLDISKSSKKYLKFIKDNTI